MQHSLCGGQRRAFALGVGALCCCGVSAVAAQDSTAPAVVVISAQTPRSTVSLPGAEIQRLLAGSSPLKALQSLPGVSFQTADPWGNNEQNSTLYVHGFGWQQLGYTLDGVPLGDQQYGNYNGLSPQRAIISENVRALFLSSGAGALATASTSNLGGTIEVHSEDPSSAPRLAADLTLGSHAARRLFLRYDTGASAAGDRFYVSALRHQASAWDFDGEQGGTQFNAKWVRKGPAGEWSAYFDYSDKVEPNEDASVHVAGQASPPYTRPFLYPDFDAALSYLGADGAPPAAAGANYRNYYSAAHRTDWLGYLKYEALLAGGARWSNQIYHHADDGFGVVGGPIRVAGLPVLFAVYFPGQDLKQVFGGSGYASRTTEYTIDRSGWLSTWRGEFGDHALQAGLWLERNRSSTYRRWYPLWRDDPSTPYQTPEDPLITQYYAVMRTRVAQFHVQDEWRLRSDLALQFGFKSSLQSNRGRFPVQPLAGAISGGSLALPEGAITTRRWFLPQLGLVWEAGAQDQFYFNVQKNLRQFVTYGAGGPSPWSLASQAAFDLFKRSAEPETAVTWELGWRGRRTLAWGPLDALDAQVNLYHVDFRDRLLQISPTPVIQAIVGGNPILANVGGVRTEGVDLALTVHGGRSFSLYNGLSYNASVYLDDYFSGTTRVATAGKLVPGVPVWLNKSVASWNAAGWEAQLVGDYVGRRPTTYTNDLSAAGYWLWSASFGRPLDPAWFKDARWRLTLTNLSQERGALNVVVGAASGTYNSYPIPPRQVFLSLLTRF